MKKWNLGQILCRRATRLKLFPWYPKLTIHDNDPVIWYPKLFPQMSPQIQSGGRKTWSLYWQFLLSYLCRFSVLCLPFVCSAPLATRRYNLRSFIRDRWHIWRGNMGKFVCCRITGTEVILFLAECGCNELEKRLTCFNRVNPFYDTSVPLCCLSACFTLNEHQSMPSTQGFSILAGHDVKNICDGARLTRFQDLAHQRENAKGLGRTLIKSCIMNVKCLFKRDF